MVLAVLLLIPAVALAGAVQLEWDHNTESDLAGYRCYFRQRYPAVAGYSLYTSVPVGVNRCTLNNMSSSRKYEYRVTAYNTSAQESGYSNAVYIGEKVVRPRMKKFTGSFR